MLDSGTRAVATYQQVQVTSRSPLELVVMLYDGAISALRQAHGAMVAGDLMTKRESMKRGLEIIQHLQSSLNMEDGGEIATKLDLVYQDVIGRVLEANVAANPALLEEALRLLGIVRDAWGAIAAAPAADASASAASSAPDVR
jgi:flagellar protein FliS